MPTGPILLRIKLTWIVTWWKINYECWAGLESNTPLTF